MNGFASETATKVKIVPRWNHRFAVVSMCLVFDFSAKNSRLQTKFRIVMQVTISKDQNWNGRAEWHWPLRQESDAFDKVLKWLMLRSMTKNVMTLAAFLWLRSEFEGQNAKKFTFFPPQIVLYYRYLATNGINLVAIENLSPKQPRQ